jgi:hypothetical protein
LFNTRTIAVLGALALLAGCSNGSLSPSSNLPAAAGVQPATMQHAKGAAIGPNDSLVFFANAKENYVEIWERTKPDLVGIISYLHKPAGLAVDAENRVYVADSGDQSVPVFESPYNGAPIETIDDEGYIPRGVAVAADGTVAVTNECSTAKGCPAGSGSIVLYAKGKTTPCSTILTPDYTSVGFGAFDSAGDFYFDGFVKKKVVVSIVQGECSGSNYNELQSDYGMEYPGSLQFGPHKRLSIIDATAETIVTYTAFANALVKFAVTPLNSKYTIQPTAFAFTKSGNSVYTVNTGGGSGEHFDFPAGGTSKQVYSLGGKPTGVAVSPPFPL